MPTKSDRQVRFLYLSPPAPDFAPVWDALRLTLKDMDIEAVRFDASDFAPYEVEEALNSSDLIIADVTGSHPAVMYELGMAHGLGKQVLLITQRVQQRLPLRGFLYEFYEPSDLEQLRQNVSSWIGQVLRAFEKGYAVA